MAAPTKAEAPSTRTPGVVGRLVSELRDAAPETRAVLGGLVLVLGAWVGPGLRQAVAAEPAVVTERVEHLGGGDAYLDAIRTAAAEEEASAVADERSETRSEPTETDQD